MEPKKKFANRAVLISTILLLFFCGNNLFAQIKFEQGSWAEIKAKAKTENKLIFVDANTSWCGPCKWMAKNIFTNDTVAQFYNTTFVNAKIDMEVGEGLEIAKLYNVRVYPSLLFINANGELVHRAAGSRPAKNFIELGRDALNPEKQFATIEKKYKNGQRDTKFMTIYLYELYGIGLETSEPLAAYLSTQKEQDLVSRDNWNLMYQFLSDYHSKEFAYLLKNKEAFSKKYTADSVNDKIFEEIKKSGFSRTEELLLSTDMNYYKKKRDFENYAKAAVPYMDKYKNSDEMMLNNVSYDFYTSVKDKALLAKAEQWAKKACELKPNDPYSMDTYACLLLVNGKKRDAVILESKAVEIIKATPGNYDPAMLTELENNITKWSK